MLQTDGRTDRVHSYIPLPATWQEINKSCLRTQQAKKNRGYLIVRPNHPVKCKASAIARKIIFKLQGLLTLTSDPVGPKTIGSSTQMPILPSKYNFFPAWGSNLQTMDYLFKCSTYCSKWEGQTTWSSFRLRFEQSNIPPFL